MYALHMTIMTCISCISTIYFTSFGPVESLGVSIFVGLSSNYLLHIAHAYHTSKIKERSIKIQRAVFIVGSPILCSSLSTIGGSAFLFACRTWLLTELGILICTVIALSLIFSMGFLLALLSTIGPLPILSKQKDTNVHTWDLMNLFLLPCWKRYIWNDDAEHQNNSSAEVSDDVDAERNIDNSVDQSDTNNILKEEAGNEEDHGEWNAQNAAEC